MERLYKNNFYELFEINPTSDSNEILNAYKNKITKLKNISNFDNNQIIEIKLLKEGLYVLLNKKLKKKYNKKINLIINNEPMIMNNEPMIMNNKPMIMNNEPMAMNNKPMIMNNEPMAMNNEPMAMNNKPMIMNNEPMAMNNEVDDSFDAVFNIDNSWMNTNKYINKDSDKKNINETNILGDRIFSLSNLNKKPGYSTKDEIDLRVPLQGRVEKQI